MLFLVRYFITIIFAIFPVYYCQVIVDENVPLSPPPSNSPAFVHDVNNGVNKDEQDGYIDSFISWFTTTNTIVNLASLSASSSGDNEFNNDAGLFLHDLDVEFDEKMWRWACSGVASIIVALTGVVPAIFLSPIAYSHPRDGGNEKKLNRLLSFAVGTLLGDVFLHILPETWRYGSDSTLRHWGMWVILGSVLCFLVEKCASKTEDTKHKAAAFVNLCANAVDNFTHGLAVGASFSISVKFGVLTTFAILIHEIPHEISDFAILLRADYDRWSAVKAQLMTATGGVVGAIVALMFSSSLELERRTACWILPFTAGGFLNVALVQVLPDLLKENSVKESVMQLIYIFIGVALMGLVSSMHL